MIHVIFITKKLRDHSAHASSQINPEQITQMSILWPLLNSLFMQACCTSDTPRCLYEWIMHNVEGGCQSRTTEMLRIHVWLMEWARETTETGL